MGDGDLPTGDRRLGESSISGMPTIKLRGILGGSGDCSTNRADLLGELKVATGEADLTVTARLSEARGARADRVLVELLLVDLVAARPDRLGRPTFFERPDIACFQAGENAQKLMGRTRYRE